MASFTDDPAVTTKATTALRRADVTSLALAAPGCRYHTHKQKSAFVNGVRLDPVSKTELAARIEEFENCGSSHVVHFCAAHPTVLARRDAAYRDLLNRGDLNVPDGIAVAWALRLFGCPAERLPGSDAMTFLCEWGVGRMKGHYLFGATPAVLARLETTLKASFPGIRIVGAESPPFRPLTDDEWALAGERINRAGADLVWVGLGAPKQDWAAEKLREFECAPSILCVGAAFDFLSGAKKRAPLWVQKSGLEWLQRFVREPRRLGRRYAIGNPRFIGSVARDYLLRRDSFRA